MIVAGIYDVSYDVTHVPVDRVMEGGGLRQAEHLSVIM